jgi:hypothetical protein
MTFRTALRNPAVFVLTAVAIGSATLSAVIFAADLNPWSDIVAPVLHQIASWF